MAFMIAIDALTPASAIACDASKLQSRQCAILTSSYDLASVPARSFASRQTCRNGRSDIERALFDEPAMYYKAAYGSLSNQER